MTLCIHNARIVGPDGVAPGGVLCGDDGRIAALLGPDDRPSADRTIDAAMRLLFPGFIDTTAREEGGNFAAAAVAGVTTVLCPEAHERMHVDVGRLGVVSRPEECAPLWDAGVLGFELAGDLPDDDAAHAILAECARLGAGIVICAASDPSGLAAPSGVAIAATPVDLKLTERDGRNAMIDALAEGAIHMIGGGFAPAVLDLAVREEITWPRACDLLSAAPARLFGIEARKGNIAPGADADLVLVDDFATRIIPPGKPASPFDGFAFRGWPMLTVLRGRVIAEDEKLVAEAPAGRAITRER